MVFFLPFPKNGKWQKKPENGNFVKVIKNNKKKFLLTMQPEVSELTSKLTDGDAMQEMDGKLPML